MSKNRNERIIPIVLENDATVETRQRGDTKDEYKDNPSNSNLNEESTELETEDSNNSDNSICSTINQLQILSDCSDYDEKKIKDDINNKTCSLPAFNVPEKIVIVLDRARDELYSHFKLNDGKMYSPLHMLKYSLLFFLRHKRFLNNKHTFALAVLNESSATWLHDFTNNVDSLLDVLEHIDECETEDIFDLDAVFDLIMSKVKLTELKEDVNVPPPHVIRVILTYSRSFTIPEFELSEDISNLLNLPYFTFDIVNTHEVPDSNNKCELIFKKLQELDTKGSSYIYSVERNSTELHNAFAKLLAHPLQRIAQKHADQRPGLNQDT